MENDDLSLRSKLVVIFIVFTIVVAIIGIVSVFGAALICAQIPECVY